MELGKRGVPRMEGGWGGWGPRCILLASKMHFAYWDGSTTSHNGGAQKHFVWQGAASSRAGRRRENFGDLRCDSLLPESIPGCKSVEIAQKFSPPAGSFSETFQSVWQFRISNRTRDSARAPLVIDRSRKNKRLKKDRIPPMALSLGFNRQAASSPSSSTLSRSRSPLAPRNQPQRGNLRSGWRSWNSFLWIELVIFVGLFS